MFRFAGVLLLFNCVLGHGETMADLGADRGIHDGTSTKSTRRLADKNLALGTLAAFPGTDSSYLVASVAFAYDFRKNWDSSMRARFGSPIVTIPNLDLDLRLDLQIGNTSNYVDMLVGASNFTQVAGLVGGYEDTAIMSIEIRNDLVQLPQISFGSAAAKLANGLSYPFFARKESTDSYQGLAMWNFVEHFGIPVLACVYSDGTPAETLCKSALEAATAAGKPYRITGVAVADMPTSYDNDKAKSAISKVKAAATKFVFLAMDTVQGRSFFAVAETEGLLTTDWQLIGSESLSLSLLGSGVNTPDGYLYLACESKGSKFADFETMWTQMTTTDMDTTDYGLDMLRAAGNVQFPTAQTFSDGAAAMAPEVPLLFDAGYAFLMAANSLLNDGTNIADIKEQRLLDAVRTVNFEGVSGTVAFDQFGHRLPVYMFENVKTVSGSKTAVASAKYSAVDGSVTEVLQVQWQDGSSSSQVPAAMAACPPGKYKNSSTLMCIECQRDTFSIGGAGTTTCNSCPSGRHQPKTGQSDCVIREIVLGVYAPLTSISMNYLSAAVLFDLDFNKNFNASLVARFGAPIIDIPNLNPNLRVKVQIGNTNSDSDTGIGMALDMLQGTNGRSKVAALVGGYHSAICEPVNQLAEQFEVPQIAWGCSSPTLSNKAEYPWFARTWPPDSIRGQAFWAWISFFQIPKVVLMYSEDSYGEGLYTATRGLAVAAGEEFRITGVGVPASQGNTHEPEVTRAKIQVAKTMKTRFIMFVMAGTQAGHFLSIASEEGLTGTDWQLFGSEVFPLAQYPDVPVGYMWFSPTNRGALFDSYADMWQKMDVNDFMSVDAYSRYGLDNLIVPLNTGAQWPPASAMFANTDDLELEQFIFDTCYAVAIAANDLMNDGVEPDQIIGQRLLDAIKASRFDAVTGPLAFDANGDRYASYNLNNVQPDGSSGKVFKVSGAYNAETASMSLNDVGLYWQSGTARATVPPHWIACTPGQYQDNATRFCEDCPAGKYSDGGAGAQCVQCPVGKLQEQKGQADCEFYEIKLGMYGPITSYSSTFMITAILFDLDFRKNFDSTLVDRFGPPIIQLPSLNENLRIKLQIGNSNSQKDVGVAMALEFFQGLGGFEKVQALVGGYHSAISMPVNNLANQFLVPQVSWGSTSPKLSNKMEYKYFSRTIPPDSLQGGGMWEFIKQFRMPAVAFLYAQESYGEGLFQTVSDKAAADGLSSKVSGVGVLYMTGDYDVEEAKAKIIVAKKSGAKFMFMAMAADQARNFMAVAIQEDVGFGLSDYQLLGSEAMGFSQLGSALAPAGYIFFSPISRGPLFPKFEEMWTKLTANDVTSASVRAYYKIDQWKYPSLDEAAAPLPATEWFENLDVLQLEDPFIFDACYTFVYAFNDMMNQGVPPDQIGGAALLEKVRQANFEGISGTVSYDPNGDRFASYTISNIVLNTGGSGRRLSEKTAVVAAIFDSAKVGSGQDSVGFLIDEGFLWQDGSKGKTIPAAFTACAPGFSASAPGEQCLKCHAGSFSLGGSMTCEDCPPGRVTNTGEELGATGCVDCDVGTVAKIPGSTVCEECPKGHVSNGTRTVCLRCPLGTYQDKVAGAKCNPCGPSQSTQFQGAEAYTDCKCLDGFYDPRIDLSTNSSCTPCPRGMECPFGSDMANYHSWTSVGRPGSYEQFPLLKASHMSLADNPLSVYECKDAERCPGGPPGSCGPSLDVTIASCAHCQESMYWSGIECRPCSDIEASAVVFPLLPMLLAPTVIALMYFMFRDDVPKWGSWQNGVAAIGFIIMNHYQVTTLANQANLDMPARVSEYYSTFAWTDDIMSIFKPQCAGYSNFEETTILRALGPIFGLVITVLTFLGSHAVQMGSGKIVAMGIDRTVNVYFSCVFTFFAGIASMALSLFKCHANPNGFHTLVKDESVHCFEDRWNSMVVVAAFAVVVYIFGCGAMFVYIIIIGPSHFSSVSFQRRWKFLFIKYRPDVWWWAIVLVARGVIMNIGYVFFELGIQQLFWIMTINFLYAMLVVYYNPWRFRRANVLEVYIFMALLLMIALLNFFAQGSVPDEDVDRIGRSIQTVIMLVNLSPFLCAAPVIFLLMRSQRDADYVQKQLAKSNSLRHHMRDMTRVSDDEFSMFLMSLDEWSVWHINKAFAVCAVEFSGNVTASKGLFPGLYRMQRSDATAEQTSKEDLAVDAEPEFTALKNAECVVEQVECNRSREMHDKSVETERVVCDVFKPDDTRPLPVDERECEVVGSPKTVTAVQAVPEWAGLTSKVEWC